MKKTRRYLTPPRKYKKKQNYKKNSSNCNYLLFGLFLTFFTIFLMHYFFEPEFYNNILYNCHFPFLNLMNDKTNKYDIDYELNECDMMGF